MGVVWITIIAFFAVSQATPLPHRVKYNQQQIGGEWNVRADFENFLFLIMPITSHGPSPATNGSLLDALSKSIPYFKHPKKHLKGHHTEDDNLPDTEEFIESKTAPYHVDISRTRSHLAKLHPEVPSSVKEEIIIARSPSVALSKSQDEPLRASRAILITVPMENEFIQRHGIKNVIGGKADIKKSVGLSIEAVEKGIEMADEMQKNPIRNKIEIIEVVKEKPKNYMTKLEEIAEEVKKNETVNKAVVMAKVIQAGLVEYFRKVAETLKEQAEKERIIDEAEEITTVPKISEGLKQKPLKKIGNLKKEKLEKDETIPRMPKVELEPPKVPVELENIINKDNKQKPLEEEGKESSKEELLLLGAENEQCGPGQERDSSGICTSINKSQVSYT